MEAKKQKKRVVIALGGNALGKNLEEQRRDVKVSAKAIADLLEENCEVLVVHGNGPQVGLINNPIGLVGFLNAGSFSSTSV